MYFHNVLEVNGLTMYVMRIITEPQAVVVSEQKELLINKKL
jgi:hypothetical protein